VIFVIEPGEAVYALADSLGFSAFRETFRIPLRLLTVDEVARVDKAWVHGFAVGREGFDEMVRQPGYGCGELVS
jgi:hypothetical protein